MTAVTSSDGTKIAFDRIGAGPPVILVDGALCYRQSGPNPALAAQLADRFTVYTYDRRGRGESGDTPPYSVDREVDDLAALIDHAGGLADVYGISSGAALALAAAKRGVGIAKLALYEAPFIVDDTRAPLPADYPQQLERLLAAGRRGDTVKLFLRQVGLPGFLLAIMPLMPAWSKLKGVAHTLPYDAAVLDGNQAGRPLPTDRWNGVTVPTLSIVGGKSPPWMHHGMQALTKVLPNARDETIPGQNHMVKAKALAPLLADFFEAGASRG